MNHGAFCINCSGHFYELCDGCNMPSPEEIRERDQQTRKRGQTMYGLLARVPKGKGTSGNQRRWAKLLGAGAKTPHKTSIRASAGPSYTAPSGRYRRRHPCRYSSSTCKQCGYSGGAHSSRCPNYRR